jgi:hypothetical protein
MFTNVLNKSDKLSTRLSYFYSNISPVNFLLFILLMVTYFIFMGTIVKFNFILALVWLIFDKIDIFFKQPKRTNADAIVLRHIPLNIAYTLAWLLFASGVALYKCARLNIMYFSQSKDYLQDSNNFFLYRPASHSYSNSIGLLFPDLVTITILYVYLIKNPRKKQISRQTYLLMKEKFVSFDNSRYSGYLIDLLIFIGLSISRNVFTLTLAVLYMIKKLTTGDKKDFFKTFSLFGSWFISLSAFLVPVIIISYDLSERVPSSFRTLLGIFNLKDLYRGIVLSLDLSNKNSLLLIVHLGIFYVSTKSIGLIFKKMATSSAFDKPRNMYRVHSLPDIKSLLPLKLTRAASIGAKPIVLDASCQYSRYFLKKISLIMDLKETTDLRKLHYLQKIPGLNFKYFCEAFKDYKRTKKVKKTNSKFTFERISRLASQNKMKIYSFLFVLSMIFIVNYLHNLYTLVFLLYILIVILDDLKSSQRFESAINYTLKISTSLCFVTFIITNIELDFFKKFLVNSFWLNFFGFHLYDSKTVTILIIFLQMALLHLIHVISKYPNTFILKDIIKKYFNMTRRKKIQNIFLRIVYYPARVLFYSTIIVFEFIGEGYTFFRIFSLILFVLSVQFDIQRKKNDFVLKLLIYAFMIIRFVIFMIYRTNLLNQKFMDFFELSYEDENFFSSNSSSFIKLIIFTVLVNLNFLKAKFEANMIFDNDFTYESLQLKNNILISICKFLDVAFFVTSTWMFYLFVMLGFAILQINIAYLFLFLVSNFQFYIDESSKFLIFPKNSYTSVKAIKFLNLFLFYGIIVILVAKVALYLFVSSN